MENKRKNMEVDITSIREFDERSNGILKINLDNLPLPVEFSNHQQTLIYIPPMQYGGNHKHPRREIFISLSNNVEVHWIDKNGTKYINKMREGNQIYMFDVHPFVPHAIVNLSKKSPAVISELTNVHQHDVESYIVYQNSQYKCMSCS